MKILFLFVLFPYFLIAEDLKDKTELKPGLDLKQDFSFLPKVVAKYSDKEMTSVELFTLIKPRVDRLGSKLLNQRELKLFVIQFLQDHYKRQASLELALKAGFEPNLGMATLRLEAMEKEKGRAEVIKQFEYTGLTYAEAPRFLAETSALNFWFEKKVAPQNIVEEAEALVFYSENRQQFEQPERVLFAQVYRGFVKEGDKLKVRTKMREAADLIQQGKPFGEIAKKFSEGKLAVNGGVLPRLFSRKDVRLELQGIFKMKINQVSDIIESAEGFHILKLLKRVNAGIPEFKVVRKALVAKLTEERSFKVMEKMIKDQKIKCGFRIYIK
jgi:hypothetical protein